MTRAVAGLVRWLLRVLLVPATAWGAGALAYLGPGDDESRRWWAISFALLGAAALVGSFLARRGRPVVLAWAAAFLGILALFGSTPASNERDWQPDVARTAHATFDGDLVTLHDVRDFDYRTELDYTPRWKDETYDLRALERVDLVAAYWMGPHIAHLFLTFGFEGGRQLAVSIETRKEKGESYSTLGGFFRQYELYYVVADERDVIRVRTNYRKDPPEDVYLFRLAGTPEAARRIFLDYLREINALHERPSFYNTATTNCTTNILMHTHVNPGSLPFSWKVLVSGHAPEYVWENGRTASKLPFDELFARSRINDAARAADPSPDFSKAIRAGLP
jgi:hypothetical protein